MKYSLFSVFFLFIMVTGQMVTKKLQMATEKLTNSNEALSANLSFYVSDENGKMIYDYNGSKGLSTASTQKIFTAATALETLGKDFTYTTTIAYSGEIKENILLGDLIVSSNGDPTLGSWRYEGHTPEDLKKQILAVFSTEGIKKIKGNIILEDDYYDHQTIPGGWPWNDLGNYYGAGIWGLNWRENQFDITIKGNQFLDFSYPLVGIRWVNELKAKGNSDQSFIYTAPYSNVAFINGSLPADKKMTVSGATPNPSLQLGYELKNWLFSDNIMIEGNVLSTTLENLDKKNLIQKNSKVIWTHQSPPLEKIVYWFLKKSVNLYGESIIKTIAKEKTGNSEFSVGISYLKDFWKNKGIPERMINFADGSGLSPQNYVAAKAEVMALLYAKKQPWFREFYEGFPVHDNAMKMKSGTMKDTKSFAGYYTDSKGNKYVFSIIINNFGGNGSVALQQILNQMK